MPTTSEIRGIEQEMASWLSHPNEFGGPPKSVRYEKTSTEDLFNQGAKEIHLVSYVMPGGQSGRGFVNGPLTWSFLGEEINAISDHSLFHAYCGWAWLFVAMQANKVRCQSSPCDFEDQFLRKKIEQGFSKIEVVGRYDLGDMVILDLKAICNRSQIKVAGNEDMELVLDETQPEFNLPAIYYLIGELIRQPAGN